MEKLLETCHSEVAKLVNQYSTIIRRLNGTIDRIDQEDEVRREFLTEGVDSVDELQLWATVFDFLFFHPGIVLELDHHSGREVAAPSHQFAQRIKSALSLATPTIWQYLYDGSHVVSEASVHLENLQVDYGDSEQDVPVTTSGIQGLLLYMLVQQTASSSDFIEGLRNHPRFSAEDLHSLAEFAIEGEGPIVEYGLVGSIQWSFALKDAYAKVQTLV